MYKTRHPSQDEPCTYSRRSSTCRHETHPIKDFLFQVPQIKVILENQCGASSYKHLSEEKIHSPPQHILRQESFLFSLKKEMPKDNTPQTQALYLLKT